MAQGPTSARWRASTDRTEKNRSNREQADRSAQDRLIGRLPAGLPALAAVDPAPAAADRAREDPGHGLADLLVAGAEHRQEALVGRLLEGQFGGPGQALADPDRVGDEERLAERLEPGPARLAARRL